MNAAVSHSSHPSYALFDFADTLAELQPGRQDVVADHIQHMVGIQVPAEHIARCYKAVDLVMQYSSVRTRTTAQRAEFYLEYNQRLLALLGVLHKVPPESLFEAFGRNDKHWALKPGVRETLAELHGRGYKIGIISNFDTRLEQIVHERLAFGGIVDHLHISQSEGIEKPDPRFYLGFFEKHGIPIGRSFYLGDSYLLDFLPATSIGLKTWLLDEAELYTHCPEAIRRVPDLLSLLPLSRHIQPIRSSP